MTARRRIFGLSEAICGGACALVAGSDRGSQIRNPKHEIRNKSEIRMQKILNVLVIQISCFVLVSDFVLRISCFLQSEVVLRGREPSC
jgi:hypothetical protein